MNRSGSSGNPITFAAYSGERAIIDGTGGPSPVWNFWTQTPIIYVNGSYITLRGLEVANASGNDSIQVYGDYVTLDQMSVRDSYGSGVNFYYTNYGSVLNSRFYNINSGGNADCIKVYGRDGGVSQGHVIRGNVVYNCSDDGVDTWLSTNNIIENNTVYHAGYDSNGNPAGDGNGFKLGSGGHNILRNNIAYGNYRRGFDDNGGCCNELHNNIAFQNPVNFRDGLSIDSTARSIDPRFASMDPSSPNFLHLATGSPAIDAGVNVGLPYSGSAPDIGAFEVGGSTTTTPPPSTTPPSPPPATPPPSAVSACPTLTTMNVAGASSDSGVAWLVAGSFGTPADVTIGATTSLLRLYENGTALGPAHTLHADIRALGQGRYSHWSVPDGSGESMRFAASDNSDPRSNGRTYAYCIGTATSGGGGGTTTPPADTTAPSVPTGLMATASSQTQINLAWSAATDNVGVVGYRVYRGGTQIATSTTPSYSNTGLTAGTSYSFTVAAYDAAGNVSSPSAAASATTQTPPDTAAPSIPSSVTASVVSTTQITLVWAGASDNVAVTGYRVYQNGTQIGTTSGTTYSATSLTAGTSYAFTVAAYDAAGNTSATSSTASATTQAPPDTAAPSVPGGISATVVSATQINLAWATSTDNVGVIGYRVYRNGTQVGTATTTSYTNTGLTAGTSYSFTVAAYDAAGNVSSPSGAASATTQAAPDTAAPSVPGSLTATAASQTRITLAWAPATDNVGVVGYKVYRSGSQIATAMLPSYSQTGLTAGTTYSYTVAAYDAAGNTSGGSTAASATTLSPPPPPPSPAPSPTAQAFELSPSNADTTCSEEFENRATTLRAGDTLILHGGTYSQTCARVLANLHGTAQQPIVIRAATGETPILTRPTRPNGDYDQNNLEIADSSYVTLQGLVFRGGDIGVRLRGTNHHITIEHSEIADTGNAGFTANSGDTDSLTLRHNQIHHTGLFTLGATEGEGLYLGCHAATCRITNSVIEQNYIHDLRGTSSGGNDGIEVKVGSGGNVIRHNVIHTTTIGTAYPCILVYGGGANPNTVEGNVVWQCGEALVALADAVVRNNIVLQSNTGLASYAHEQVAVLQNVTFVNNTVYGHAECASLRWAGAVNVVLANNALYCGVNVALYAPGFSGPGTQAKSNYVEGALVGGSLDGTRFLAGGTAAGSFINPAALDFWPQAGSSLRNTADAAYLPSTDFNGLPRTPSRDVGAYATRGLSQNVGWRITPGFKVLSADGTAPTRPRGLRVR